MTLYEVSLLYYQMTTNIVVNRNLASVIRNWKNYSECFHVLIKSCIFLQDELKLSIWLKKNYWQLFNFIEG